MKSPKLTSVVIDERGYPFEMQVLDPQAFTLHKVWLAARADHELFEAERDPNQAELITTVLRERLLHLGFDDPALSALALGLRERAGSLATGLNRGSSTARARRCEPD